MIYVATLMSYGDCLITLSLIEKAGPAASEFRVIGTAVTRAVAGLMRRPPPMSAEIFDDVAAFYNVRTRGVAAAIRDLVHFRRWAGHSLGATDTLILEKGGLRNRLLTSRRWCSVIEVPRAMGAYVDRERALRPFLGKLPWQPNPVARGVAHRLLVNPSARMETRVLSNSVIESVLNIASECGSEVCLIDVDGRYQALESRVHTYMEHPSLADAAAALRHADRYIGPDSFFMHLAYYFRVPYLAFFWPTDMYFAPPGLLEGGNYITYADAADANLLRAKLRMLLVEK